MAEKSDKLSLTRRLAAKYAQIDKYKFAYVVMAGWWAAIVLTVFLYVYVLIDLVLAQNKTADVNSSFYNGLLFAAGGLFVLFMVYAFQFRSVYRRRSIRLAAMGSFDTRDLDALQDMEQLLTNEMRRCQSKLDMWTVIGIGLVSVVIVTLIDSADFVRGSFMIASVVVVGMGLTFTYVYSPLTSEFEAIKSSRSRIRIRASLRRKAANAGSNTWDDITRTPLGTKLFNVVVGIPAMLGMVGLLFYFAVSSRDSLLFVGSVVTFILVGIMARFLINDLVDPDKFYPRLANENVVSH